MHDVHACQGDTWCIGGGVGTSCAAWVEIKGMAPSLHMLGARGWVWGGRSAVAALKGCKGEEKGGRDGGLGVRARIGEAHSRSQPAMLQGKLQSAWLCRLSCTAVYSTSFCRACCLCCAALRCPAMCPIVLYCTAGFCLVLYCFVVLHCCAVLYCSYTTVAGKFIKGAELAAGPGSWQQRVVGSGYKQVQLRPTGKPVGSCREAVFGFTVLLSICALRAVAARPSFVIPQITATPDQCP